MHKILSYIRHNRIKFFAIILFIIFVYSLIHSANNAYKSKGEVQKSTTEETIKTDGTVRLTNKNCEEVLNSFLEKCTEGNYEEAYTYLSEDCKNNKYKTLKDFEEKYCMQNAIKGKGYDIEKTSNQGKYEYKIIFNNLLSSGKANSNRTTVEYYKITVDNGHDIKISIN